MKVQATVIAVLVLTTEAFVPTKNHLPKAALSPLKASSWKDLPPPELPAQTVNSGFQQYSQQSFSDFFAKLPKLDLPSVESPSSRPPVPEQVNLESLSNLLSTFLSTQWQLEAIAAVTVGALFNRWLNSPLDFSKAPFEPGTDTYSPEKSDAFYQDRPWMVLKRLIKLGYISGAFTTGVLFDWLVLGKLMKDEEYMALKKAEPRRAREALRLCEQLGPTFIKLVGSFDIFLDPCAVV